MSDNGFIRLDRLKTALSQVKTKVDSDIASAISESTISLTSLINSGDASTLSEAKGYADGLKIIIDSNISSGDSSTLTSANSYTDSKISSVNLTINDLNESIPGQINLALETYENSIDYADATDLSNHTSNTNNPHSVTYSQTGAAAASHTHTESDITDLGNYASSSHTHTVSDLTDASTELAAKSHTHTTSEITNFGNYANSSHSHVEADITDLGSYASSSHTHTTSEITDASTELAAASHTHTESDITDLGNYAASSHTHTVSDIIDASSLANSSHTHLLSDVTDVTASNTEVNYLVNSTRNIQTQINDARMYGFFPAWEYEHEYSIGNCIRIPCCKTTQYLECIVGGVSGSCPEWPTGQTEIYYTVEDGQVVRHERSIDYKLDEFISIVNGQCIIDGTCVWLVQDIRDARVVGSIIPLLWRPIYVYDAFDNYGIGLVNITRLYDGRSSKQSDMSKSNNLKFIRLLKRIIGSAIFTLNMSRIFRLNSNSAINSSSSTELSHMGGALIILDWCFRPFDYLSSSHYNDIDSRASQYIENMLSDYNSTFSVNLTKTQIVNDAIAKKTKIYNNQVTDDNLYFEMNKISKYGIMQSGHYGIFQDAGLPNITGSFTTSPPGDATAYGLGNHKGAFYSDTSSTDRTTIASSGGVSRNRRTLFSAANSNSIYGNSTTVQPNTIAVYYYMKY